MKHEWRVLAPVCGLVIGVYAYMSQSPIWEPWKSWSPDAANAAYNLLVQGFQAGQLSLKQIVPTAMLQLADPYDPSANDLYREAPYKFHDLSYYKGRLYIYFGVAPALLLFWPFAALTGHYLLHREAVLIFCTIGFLVGTILLRALWRRYFAEVSVGVVAAGVLALGLATGAPELLSWAGVYEVPISCGYMLTMLTLGAIWCALHETERNVQWLAAASTAYGLAVASRPSLVFGAIILLVPVARTWREGKRIVFPLLAAVGPITLIGLGLMLYNVRRFDSPFEFGLHYQLTAKELISRRFLGLKYLWFHFRVYFLEPARWGGRFPFIHNIAVPRVPPDYYEVANPFGVLTNIPVVWLAFAAPLAWWNRSPQADSRGLRWFVGALALLLGVCLFTLCLYFCSALRYEVDFLPTLMLLAVVGILGCERALVDRPGWRRSVRLTWGLLLGFSIAFNLLVTLENYSINQFEVGTELLDADKPAEAATHYEQALRLKPDYADAHANLGTVLAMLGKPQDAVRHFEEALRIEPANKVTHYNFGCTLYQMGRVPEAIKEFETALQIWPGYAEAHNSLGGALLSTGDLQSAIAQYNEALQLKPDYAEAHANLGLALLKAGRIPEAIGQYEEALRISPGDVKAHYNLALALAREGQSQEAIDHFQQALRIKPDYVEAHFNLGLTLEKMGRTPEAIEQYEQVLKLRPDFMPATQALARLQAGQ